MAQTALCGIYEIVNIVTGNRYIGSAINFHRRELIHRRELVAGKHHSYRLQAAWLKHGAEAFVFRIIELCEPGSLIAREQVAIDTLRPSYNVSPTAGSILGLRFSSPLKGKKRSPEAVAKTAAAHRGMKRSAETRANISAKTKGRKFVRYSEEYRTKLSAALSGRQKSAAHMAALQAGRARRIYTPEQRAKVSEALKARYENGTLSKARPAEYREKIARSLKGRRLSEQHRANVSAAMRGKKRGSYKKRYEVSNEPGLFDLDCESD